MPNSNGPEHIRFSLERFMNKVSDSLFGMSIVEAHQAGLCIDCKKPAVQFNDIISAQEYKISALCQQCQNKVFNSPNA